MKSYTTIEQSKKLAEILPLESADMSFVEKGDAKRTWYDAENRRITTAYEKKYYIPCWSLAALLGVLPKYIGDYGKCLYYDIGGCYCGYMDDGDFMTGVEETNADNPVDACVEMILKLHQMELL